MTTSLRSPPPPPPPPCHDGHAGEYSLARRLPLRDPRPSGRYAAAVIPTTQLRRRGRPRQVFFLLWRGAPAEGNGRRVIAHARAAAAHRDQSCRCCGGRTPSSRVPRVRPHSPEPRARRLFFPPGVSLVRRRRHYYALPHRRRVRVDPRPRRRVHDQSGAASCDPTDNGGLRRDEGSEPGRRKGQYDILQRDGSPVDGSPKSLVSSTRCWSNNHNVVITAVTALAIKSVGVSHKRVMVAAVKV